MVKTVSQVLDFVSGHTVVDEIWTIHGLIIVDAQELIWICQPDDVSVRVEARSPVFLDWFLSGSLALGGGPVNVEQLGNMRGRILKGESDSLFLDLIMVESLSDRVDFIFGEARRKSPEMSEKFSCVLQSVEDRFVLQDCAKVPRTSWIVSNFDLRERLETCVSEPDDWPDWCESVTGSGTLDSEKKTIHIDCLEVHRGLETTRIHFHNGDHCQNRWLSR